MDHYHHGDLRRALLDRAAAQIASSGAHSLSLRSLAASEGVSHAAPRHHFGSLEGLLTQLAVEGYTLLAQACADLPFAELGETYVRFALEHPGHFTVMFDSDLINVEDPDFTAASAAAFAALTGGVDQLDDPRARQDRAAATVAAWSMMHGLITLSRSGTLERANVTAALGNPDLLELAGRAARMLYRQP